MPGGFSEPLGLLAFPAIKAGGYMAFAVFLNRSFPDSPRNIVYVGGCRMLLGLAFGTVLALFSFPFVFVSGLGLLVYIIGLIPVRGLEWWIIIRGFYGHKPWNEVKAPIILGIVWSFLLDVPALIGLVYTASFWIC